MKFKCNNCNIEFERSKSNSYKTRKTTDNHYCSKKCFSESKSQKIHIKCQNCNKLFSKKPSKISKNNFCSKSCAATYNNRHKKHGVRRSKLEKYIEQQLNIIYPELKILFNNKEVINSELDIYIPLLNLAFELNGIFHYEPIYGDDKLKQIQNNDHRKFQACLERGIELCIIDTSSQKYFKEKTSQKFLNIIINIINIKWS